MKDYLLAIDEALQSSIQQDQHMVAIDVQFGVDGTKEALTSIDNKKKDDN